ncbi:MAG: hypothetical protein ACT443_11940, partial [Gemmatimonadota bacterium]
MSALNTKLTLIVLLLAACADSRPSIEPVAGPFTATANEADPALAIDSSTGDVLMTWVAGDTTNYHLYF